MSDTSIWSANGAPISARMAREQLYLSSGGQTGVIHPDSLKVSAQGTPDNTVLIQPGSFAITATSRTAAIGYTSAPWQSYGRSVYESMTVELDPTGSSGGRTDVIGIIIEDPEFDGLDLTEEQLRNHPFWRPYVVRNAGNNATRPEHFASLRKPFLPLAQVRIPASTGTFTDAMIHDIRYMAITRSQRIPLIDDARPDGSSLTLRPEDTQWTTVTTFDDIQVPQWASQCVVEMMLGPVYTTGGAANGQFRVRTTGENNVVSTRAFDFVEPDHREQTGGSQRIYLHAAATISLARVTAGAFSKFELQIRMRPAPNRTGRLVVPSNTLYTCRAVGSATYEEAPR